MRQRDDRSWRIAICLVCGRLVVLPCGQCDFAILAPRGRLATPMVVRVGCGFERCVHALKIAHVSLVNIDADDIVGRKPRTFKNSKEILETLCCLFTDRVGGLACQS